VKDNHAVYLLYVIWFGCAACLFLAAWGLK
jgi:hypothetical protein